jgi:hypothetical protein
MAVLSITEGFRGRVVAGDSVGDFDRLRFPTVARQSGTADQLDLKLAVGKVPDREQLSDWHLSVLFGEPGAAPVVDRVRARQLFAGTTSVPPAATTLSTSSWVTDTLA